MSFASDDVGPQVSSWLKALFFFSIFYFRTGTVFSVAAFGDCSLVAVDPGISVTERSVGDLTVDRIGLLTFARPGMSTCYWYEDGNDPESQLQEYFNYLGDDWYFLRIYAAVGASGGAFFFLYTLSMCCSSHVKALRAVVAFMLCVALALFQCLIFLVFTTDLCSEHACTFSRSAGWSVGAALCYFVSGVCYLLMSDYPGQKTAKEIPGSFPSSKTPTVPVAPVDETMIQDDHEERHMDEEEEDLEDGGNVVVAESVDVFDNHEKIEDVAEPVAAVENQEKIVEEVAEPAAVISNHEEIEERGIVEEAEDSSKQVEETICHNDASTDKADTAIPDATTGSSSVTIENP